MAEDVIDHYVDRNGIRQDTDFMLSALRELYAELKKVDGVKITGLNGQGLNSQAAQAKAGFDSLAVATEMVKQRIAEMNGQSKEFTQVLINQAKAQKEAAAAALLEAKAATESAKAAAAAAKSKTEELKAITEVAKAKTEEAKAANELRKAAEAEQKAREKLNKEAEKSAALLRNSNKELKDSAKASAEVAASKNTEVKATEQSAASKAKEAKLIDQAVDDYYQLSRAYNEAALKAKNYVLRLGENHPIAVQAIKDANDLGNVLKKLDASVGQNQRNVGNYKSAFDGLGFSFTQVARELPTLSQSFELFARAIGNNLPMVSDEIGKAKKEIAQLRAEGKETPGLFSRIAKSVFGFQVLLSVGITLFTVYSKQFGNFISNIFRSTRAIDQLKREQELLNEIQKEVAKSTGDEIAKLQVLYRVATNAVIPIQERRKAVDELQKQYPEHFKNLNDEIILQGKAADAYDKTKAAILETAKARAIESKLATLASKELELLLDKENAARKAEKNRLDQVKADARDGRDAETRGLDQFAAISKGSELKKKIGDINADLKQLGVEREFLLNQITNSGSVTGGSSSDKIKSNLDKINKLLADARKTAFEILKLRMTDQIQASLDLVDNEKLSYAERLRALDAFKNDSAKLLLLQRKFDENELNIETANAIEEIKRRGKEEKLSRVRIQEEINAAVQVSLLKQQQIRETYFSDLLKLEKSYGDKALNIVEDNAKKRLDIETKLKDGLERLAKEAYENGLKYIKLLRGEKDKDYDEEEKRIIREKALKKRLMQELADETTNLAFTIFTADIERDKNALQDQINLLEEKKAKDIEVANQTIVNAQERAAAIATIEARANTQKEALQRKQKELDIKKAQFDKAQSIARIVQETAKNIVEAFPNVFLQGLAAALGAVQLASVLAQPIPRYKDGKNVSDNYEGPAIVGDGGRKEAIIREDGSIEITKDTPQMTFVGRNDVILPDANKIVKYIIASQMGTRIHDSGGVNEESQIVNEVKGLRKDIYKAVGKIPQPKITVANVLRQRMRYGSSINDHITRSLGK